MTVVESRPRTVTRISQHHIYLDNLKVVLVCGVIVAHAIMAWTGVGTWVVEERHVREPLLSLLGLVAVVGALFGMALFFMIAGMFTPRSVARKGLRRFLVDRTLRLGVPMVFFIVAFSPIVEYADSDNVGWSKGFPAFARHIWWPPAPGPTWFLGVLLLFSVVYAVLRTVWPRRAGHTPMPGKQLVVVGLVCALASYAIRLWVPLGEERWHLAIGQAPAWILGFALGVVGSERGWLDPIDPVRATQLRKVAWAATGACALTVVIASATGADIDTFGGGGSFWSLLIAVVEGALVVAMSLWIIDLFRRRYDHQGRLVREMSRGAFVAFVVHQVVLVGLVLASRHVPLPPEVEFTLVAVLGVALSFAVASLVVRVPGVRRFT